MSTTITAPHPGADVALVGTVGAGAVAHRIEWRSTRRPYTVDGSGSLVDPAGVLSWARARDLGATPCQQYSCWGSR